jgi:hypothetical protein
MTVRATDVTRFIHHGRPTAGAELAITFVAVMEPMPSWLVWPFRRLRPPRRSREKEPDHGRTRQG